MKSLYLWTMIALLPALAAADVCSGTKATVSIADVSYAGGMLKAGGSWNVGEGSLGAILEYRVQSNRQWVESRPGISGEWILELPYDRCGRSTFEVQVLARVKSGEIEAVCLESMGKAVQHFVVDCKPKAVIGSCQWECVQEKDQPARCAGTCEAGAEGGLAGLVAMVAINDQGFQAVEGPDRGPWTLTLSCSPGDRISFKVRDHLGRGPFSDVAETLCGKE